MQVFGGVQGWEIVKFFSSKILKVVKKIFPHYETHTIKNMQHFFEIFANFHVANKPY